jgi:predicted transcriptional regulator
VLEWLEDYYAKLRRRIADAGLQEVAVALSSGMHPAQFSRFVQGKCDAKLSTVTRVERALAGLVAARVQ